MEVLLTADEEAGGFLATPAHRAAAELLADTSGETAPLVDRELGPYRLVREIGSGGMGVVYRPRTPASGAVAMKLLPPEADADRGAQERFLARRRRPRPSTIRTSAPSTRSTRCDGRCSSSWPTTRARR